MGAPRDSRWADQLLFDRVPGRGCRLRDLRKRFGKTADGCRNCSVYSFGDCGGSDWWKRVRPRLTSVGPMRVTWLRVGGILRVVGARGGAQAVLQSLGYYLRVGQLADGDWVIGGDFRRFPKL